MAAGSAQRPIPRVIHRMSVASEQQMTGPQPTVVVSLQFHTGDPDPEDLAVRWVPRQQVSDHFSFQPEVIKHSSRLPVDLG